MAAERHVPALHRRAAAAREGLLRDHQPAGEFVQAARARLRSADRDRVVREEPQSARARAGDARHRDTRIELRMPDPSCNPYLALAVMLRAGLDGIDQKIDPGPPVNKNIYKMSHRERRHLRIDDLPGEPQRGARRAREGRPHPRDARRAHLPALPRSQARGVGRLHPPRLAVGDRPLPARVLTYAAHVGRSVQRRAGRCGRRRSTRDSRDFLSVFDAIARLARVLKSEVCGRDGSPGCANFRQALASPHPGRKVHDPAAATYRASSRRPLTASRPRGSEIDDVAPRRFVAALRSPHSPPAARRGASIGAGEDQSGPLRRQERHGARHGHLVVGHPARPASRCIRSTTARARSSCCRDDSRIPSKGARVRVTGKVSEFAVFGGRSIGLHLRERDLDYSGR